MVKKKTSHSRKKTKQKGFKAFILKNKPRAFIFSVIILLLVGIVGYAAVTQLTASAAECRQTSSKGHVHLTNKKMLFKSSSDVGFCVAEAKGDIVMTIRNSNNDQQWTQTIKKKDLPAVPKYKLVSPNVKLQTGAYTFALLDKGSNKRIDASFGVTGVEPERDPYYGVNTHYIKGKTSGTDGRADLKNTYPLLDQIGVSMVRETVRWDAVEKSKNKFEIPGEYVTDFMNSAKAGKDPVIFVASYGNPLWTGDKAAPPVTDLDIKKFAAYIDFVLKKYPQIQYVEIYNEYDHVADKTKNSRTSGTGKEYAEMFKKTAKILRSEYKHPKVKIVAGNISTLAGSGGDVSQNNDHARFNKWWDDFGRAGGFGAADALSFHRYDDTMPSNGSAYHLQLDAVVKRYNNNKSKPIIVSEVGLTTAKTGQWRGVVTNERDQAAGLIRTYVGYQRGGVVSNVLWYDAIDDGIDQSSVEHNWGLFKRPTPQVPYAYQPKWSALAFYWMRRELDEGYRLTNVSQPVAGVQQYVFSKGDSKRYVLWRDKNFASNDHASVNVTINIRKDAKTNVYNMLGERMSAKDQKYPSGKITIPVWTTPMYVNN